MKIDTWRSDDPTVATVDADARVVVGVALGETWLNAYTLERSVDTGESYLSAFNGLTVTLVAPTAAH